jgi:hypothetical protein
MRGEDLLLARALGATNSLLDRKQCFESGDVRRLGHLVRTSITMKRTFGLVADTPASATANIAATWKHEGIMSDRWTRCRCARNICTINYGFYLTTLVEPSSVTVGVV